MADRYLLSQCCQAILDLSAHGEVVTCPTCGKQYDVREEVDFAEYSSGSYEQYKWSSDGSHVVRYHFHNMTLERLEGVAEQIKLLSLCERKPHVLLPIFKALHDCLKKRLQQYLADDSTPVLTREQKARIEIDEPTNNLMQLVGFLCRAHPVHAQKINALGADDCIQALIWLRNKEEHLAVAAWPASSHVHTARERLPSEPNGSIAILSTELLIDMINRTIDLLTLIYDLCPADVRQWHYDRLDEYRLHKSV